VYLLSLSSLSHSVEARSVAQIKAEVVASQAALPDAPVGATVAQLSQYTKKKLLQVIPSGIGAQLPGDRENNEEAVKQVKFDLRWAVSRTHDNITSLDRPEHQQSIQIENEFMQKNHRSSRNSSSRSFGSTWSLICVSLYTFVCDACLSLSST